MKRHTKLLHLALLTLAGSALLGTRVSCSGGTSPTEPVGNRLEIRVEGAQAAPGVENTNGAVARPPEQHREPVAATP